MHAVRLPGRRRRERPSPTRTARRCARTRRHPRIGQQRPWPPAEPSGSRTAPARSASRWMYSGGLVRLTTMRSCPGPAAVAGAPWGVAGMFAVLRIRPWAGSATAPTLRSPRSQSATWTAQSVRPGSPNSLVPSSGSTIQTLLADSRAGSSRPSSDSTASAGRSVASSAQRNSCDSRSPSRRRPSWSPPTARSVMRRRPASAARSWARRSSREITTQAPFVAYPTTAD